jgi:hypothetical protein
MHIMTRPSSQLPRVNIAVDLEVAPLFHEGGPYEGKVLNIDPENAARTVGIIDVTNQQMSAGISDDIGNSTVNIRATVDGPSSFIRSKYDGSAIISKERIIGIPVVADNPNQTLGYNTQKVLDQSERISRTSYLATIATLPLTALVIPGAVIAHFKRLSAIKEGSRANQKRRQQSQELAERMPAVISIDDPSEN